MKKTLLLAIAIAATSTTFSQNEVEEEVVIQYFLHYYIKTFPEYDEFNTNTIIGNSHYTKSVKVDDAGLFHSLHKRLELSPRPARNPWDSLYYANQGRLTFYFEEEYYKMPDTTHISDLNYEMPMQVYAGRTNGVFINGKKEGLWEKYCFSPIEGQYVHRKVIEESYKEGLIHGVRKVYGLDGKELHQTIFVNGTGNYEDYYYDTGKRAVSGFTVYGRRHGLWTYFNKESKIIKDEYYKHGLLHGERIIYDDSGNTLFKTNFKNGTGEYRHYRNGIMKEHGKMINGRRIGMWDFIRIGSNSVTPNQDPGVRPREYNIIYKEDNPVNDAANIVDCMFNDGEYVYIRAMREKKDGKAKTTDE